MRTLRSKKARALLWFAADGKCQICGEPLLDDWHADHIIPYKISKETNVHEMQALCPTCNLKKGNRMLRQHQRSIMEICDEILAGKPIKEIIASVTPGGGKSALPVICASKLIPTKADALCWVVPRISLRQQGEEAFIDPQFRMFLRHNHLIRQSTNDLNPCREFQGHITTYQAIAQDPSTLLKDFFRKRYILFLDEPHHVAVGSPFEKALRPLIQNSILTIYASGTLERNDKKQIAFLPYLETEMGAVVNHTETEARRFITYTRRMALEEKPRAIVPLEFEISDGKAEWVDSEGNYRSVDSFYGADVDVKAALRTSLETSFARTLLDKCIEHWQGHKRFVFPKAKLLIVAPRIKVAKDYYDYIKDKGIRCAIVHSEEADEITQRKIKRYKKGNIDALITVAIAYEGLDVPAITHIACLTHYRSKPWLEQCFARANRIVKGKDRGFIFAPDDPDFNIVMENLRLEQESVARIINENEPGQDEKGANERGTINGEIVPQDSRMTETRVVAPNLNEIVTAEQYRLIIRARDNSGLPQGISIAQLNRFLLEAGLSTFPNDLHEPDINAPLVTPTQQQNNLLKNINTYTKQVDKKYFGMQWATTNKELYKIFGKRREEMTIEELQGVWRYLQHNYPMSNDNDNQDD